MTIKESWNNRIWVQLKMSIWVNAFHNKSLFCRLLSIVFNMIHLNYLICLTICFFNMSLSLSKYYVFYFTEHIKKVSFFVKIYHVQAICDILYISALCSWAPSRHTHAWKSILLQLTYQLIRGWILV